MLLNKILVSYYWVCYWWVNIFAGEDELLECGVDWTFTVVLYSATNLRTLLDNVIINLNVYLERSY
jgi:hypothetical protein